MSHSYDAIIGRKIRIALVGYGRIAEKHLEAIRAHGDRLELVAVCDVDRAALDGFLSSVEKFAAAN